MKLASIVSFLAAALALASCTRDQLYYSTSDMTTVLVETDWSASGVNPNGVSVFAYNEADGSLYRRFPPVAAHQECRIRLPQGDYTLVVMNDSPEEFDGTIAFCDQENINTFQARGVKDEQKSTRLAKYLATKAENTSSDDYCIVEPDTLAVAVARGIHISPQQMDYYDEQPQDNTSAETVMEVPVKPVPVISTVNIKAHVKGLKYARGATTSFLRGVAAGHYPGLEKNTNEQTAQTFTLNNRVFDPGSDSDGTITAKFLSFGLTGKGDTDSRYYLDINFVLVNGEAYPMTFDVTDLISVDVALSLKLSLNLDLEIELPEVTGEGDEGGFNPGVGEWEEEIIDIPM
ncbi:MAG: DUF5119 domain-containing protein [Prevotella sp.]